MDVKLNMPNNLAIDTQSLGNLRAQAKQSPDQALKAAAQQFEAVFMNMMLKSMRDATPQDGMMDSDQTRMFTGMLDQQLAQSMSSRGLGLADMMVKQLSQSGQSARLSQLSTLANSSASYIPQPVMPELRVSSKQALSNGDLPQDFVGRMLPHAIAASKETGVPAQLMLGQAVLESGWGKREILNSDGSNSFNLFGIKAGNGWHGKVAEVMTTEYKGGIASKQVEKFRAYSSYTEAFNDYAALLTTNPRYSNVLQQTDSPAGMAQALQKSGYATDPKYAEKLVSVMKQLNSAG